MKKKANGEGSIRQRSDGTWEARFYVDGERKSVYASTKTEVRKLLTAAMSDIDNDEYLDETDMTVADWLPIWLSDFCQARESTKKRYDIDIRCHIVPALGKCKLKELTVAQVQHLYKELERKGMSPKTIRNLHGVFHSALKTAVNLDYIKRNVTERCLLPKAYQSEMHPLLDNYTGEFLKAVESEEFRDMYIIDMFTGLREAELVGLTWDCINFSTGVIHVYRQLRNISTSKNRGMYEFSILKNGKSRDIMVAQQIMDLFRKIKEEQVQNKERLGSAYSNVDNLVFTYPNGKHISNHTVYNHLKSIVRKMGRPEVRVHDLRHTFATLSLQNGTDPKTVSDALGHASVSFTLDRYGHVSTEMRSDSANRMTSFIKDLQGSQIPVGV